MAVNAEPRLPVQMQMVYTNSPATEVGGVLRFGTDWPAPFSGITASFLGQVK
jgi:hypothetical protein